MVQAGAHALAAESAHLETLLAMVAERADAIAFPHRLEAAAG